MSLADVSSIATAAGVVLVALQLRFSGAQTRTGLEDELTRQYREICERLPPQAFFDRNYTDPEFAIGDHLVAFASYLDLCNQQIFLRSEGRISRDTWVMWADGMRDNIVERDAFQRAWRHLGPRMGRSFNELRRFEKSDWLDDPRDWGRPGRARIARMYRRQALTERSD